MMLNKKVMVVVVVMIRMVPVVMIQIQTRILTVTVAAAAAAIATRMGGPSMKGCACNGSNGIKNGWPSWGWRRVRSPRWNNSVENGNANLWNRGRWMGNILNGRPNSPIGRQRPLQRPPTSWPPRCPIRPQRHPPLHQFFLRWWWRQQKWNIVSFQKRDGRYNPFSPEFWGNNQNFYKRVWSNEPMRMAIALAIRYYHSILILTMKEGNIHVKKATSTLITSAMMIHMTTATILMTKWQRQWQWHHNDVPRGYPNRSGIIQV